MTSSTTTQRQNKTPQQIAQDFHELTPEQTFGKLAGLPAQTVYEAKWALQQVSQHWEGDGQQLVEIVEPLARMIGQAEAFIFDKTVEMQTVKSLIGTQVSNGGRNRN